MWKAPVGFWEFEELHVRTPGAHVIPSRTRLGNLRKGCSAEYPVTVGVLELAVALARSATTLAPDQKTGFWRGMAAYARVREACEWKGKELRARPYLLKTLRDSSRTALAADLGQAMTWLFAIEKLKMSAVVDFGRGCGLLTQAVPGPKAFNKRPDFMAANGALHDIILLESKGMILSEASDASWGKSLVDGLEQIDAGKKWLSQHGAAAVIANKYSVSFGLIEKGPSIGVVVDPPERTETELDAPTRLALLRMHAANWALAAGDLQLAASLVDPERESERVRRVDRLPETERYGVSVKMGFRTLDGYSHRRFTPVIHLISRDLIDAVARDDLERALAAIDAFNAKIALIGATGHTEMIEDKDRPLALPDGTGAEWLTSRTYREVNFPQR